MLKNKYKLVANCQSFDELEKVIKKLGNIKNLKGKTYTSEGNLQRLNYIKSGYPLNYMTRAYGLRAKVAELMWYKSKGI